MSVNAFWFVNGMGWGALLTLAALIVAALRRERRNRREADQARAAFHKRRREEFPDGKTPPDWPSPA